MNYYEILQVSPDADLAVIKGAYKFLAQKWHPDKNPDKVVIASRMTALLNEAYGTLSDPLRRKEYDERIGIKKEKDSSGTQQEVWSSIEPAD